MSKTNTIESPARKFIRLALTGAASIAGITFIWLILQHFISQDPFTMKDMLEPEGRFVVLLMLWSAFATILLAALYLIEVHSSVETEPGSKLDVISLFMSRLGALGILGIVIVMMYEVVARYGFSGGTLWANELSLWIAGFVFLLAGLYAMQQRSHIRIYVIYNTFPRWMQKVADVISTLLMVTFTYCLVWGSFDEVVVKLKRMETFGTAWDSPLPSTLKAGILIIIGLVAAQMVLNLIVDWKKVPESHSPMDEVDEHEIAAMRQMVGDK